MGKEIRNLVTEIMQNKISNSSRPRNLHESRDRDVAGLAKDVESAFKKFADNKKKDIRKEIGVSPKNVEFEFDGENFNAYFSFSDNDMEKVESEDYFDDIYDNTGTIMIHVDTILGKIM